MWAGCRAFNGRQRPLVPIALVGGVVVTGITLLSGPDGGDWAGAWALYIAVVVFTGLAGYESVRGSLLRSVNGRVLAIVFFAVAIYYALRLGVYLIAGETSIGFTVYFGTITTTFIAIVLVIVAAISMSVLQPPRIAAADRDGRRSSDQVIDGVPSLEHFEQQARDWLLRAKRDREPLVLLAVVVDNFDDITTAFGRELGEEALTLVGRMACENTPSAALVGYVSDERFLILTTPPTFGSPVDIAERLQTSLVETAVDAEQGVRATATFGLVTTDNLGYSLADLEYAARTAMRAAQAIGPGSVLVGTETEPIRQS
jgi:diguanylate cyclase (GGDEF)-like protein